ncbi:MAG: DJ-1/PfpI family protein [Bacillota bacterium]
MANKIGILLENRFIDQEIIYYENYFREEGFEVEFLTRLWGQPELTFQGLELQLNKTVQKSFENISEEELDDFKAFILPAGYVADYLLYSKEPGDLSPAVRFIKKIMENKTLIKGFICHSLWIAGPIPEVFENRKVTCHNNIIGHVKNTGALYQDQDIVVDGELVTARHGGLFAAFAKKIIEEINKPDDIKTIIYRDEIEKEDIGGGIIMQNLGNGKRMNVLHWNMEDGSIVDWHEHPHEQFGYVIEGGFKIYMGDEEYKLEAGDAYFVPSNTQHKFIAIEDTEAIDVFNPVRENIPGRK